MNNTIRALQNEFDTAELNADTETLQRLIADDFLSIGQKGFVLDKQEWIDRHGHFLCGCCGIVRGGRDFPDRRLPGRHHGAVSVG